MLLLKCPKCRHNMKYQSRDTKVKGKSKRCVYCGRSFVIGSHIVRRL